VFFINILGSRIRSGFKIEISTLKTPMKEAVFGGSVEPPRDAF